MREFLTIFNLKEEDVIYKCFEEFEIRVNSQKIKIKISVDKKGSFRHSLNYHYHGKEQAFPYHSSTGSASTKIGAYQNAYYEIFSFYDENDDQAIWAYNENY